ncbi:MAG: hydantoinase/oxoprolinase family protein, partial [Planctomycetaceae bacterium]|nr:hydantoinase/oxoprolinase family protein [Planctomycetaceae bacterium]
MAAWQFWIDVGGTFTDCIGFDPEGQLRTFKTLSSGATRGVAVVDPRSGGLTDPARRQDPAGFWDGALLRIEGLDSHQFVETRITRFDAATGTLISARELAIAFVSRGTSTHETADDQTLKSVPEFHNGAGEGPAGSGEHEQTTFRYELRTRWEAPVLAIRYLLRLSADDRVPEVDVRFGTTRGTNALLTRTGARTVLLTTAGFADLLLIGNQTRPDLFALNIERPLPLYASVIEVEERIAADGTVLRPLQAESVQASNALDQLIAARSAGIESVAICLLNAWRNDDHERLLEHLAREAGFQEISRSSEVSPLIRLVDRGHTTTLDAYLNPILRSYLTEISDQLPGSRLQVMTSAGGLVDHRHFRGRDCVLSGPAGGIVGFAQAARRRGFTRAIGFDMGGTSTD